MQARYIILNGGSLIIGSKEVPYPGKATITLWGGPKERELPGFGAKCIAVRSGDLRLHGRHKEPVWTQLAEGSPMAAGDGQLTVQGAVNWQRGDHIVVAPSSFDATHVDELTIATVQHNAADNTTTITTEETARFEHLAAVIREHESDTGLRIDMRAEVAVLSRDVVIEGDEDSARDQFGAHVMMHSPPELGPEAQSNMWVEQVRLRGPGSLGLCAHALRLMLSARVGCAGGGAARGPGLPPGALPAALPHERRAARQLRPRLRRPPHIQPRGDNARHQ